MARNRFAHSHNGPRHRPGGNSPSAVATPAVSQPIVARSNGGMQSAPSTQRVEAKPAPVTQEAIAQAAYFLWLQRGGNDVMNWLEAERMLTSAQR